MLDLRGIRNPETINFVVGYAAQTPAAYPPSVILEYNSFMPYLCACLKYATSSSR